MNKTILVLAFFLIYGFIQAVEPKFPVKETFKNPSLAYFPKPLWFWNNTKVTSEGIDGQMQAFRDNCNYGGFGILPFGEKKVPKGKLMAVVAMEKKSLKRLSLSAHIVNGELTWKVPVGDWKLMFFICVKDCDPIVDYLDPEPVSNFIRMTHEAYYSRFKKYFGTVITGTFFDEPTIYRANGRMWTPRFNEKFKKKYGFDPELYYPALWYDIGPETRAARNYLFGFRTELYAKGFTKTINDSLSFRFFDLNT